MMKSLHISKKQGRAVLTTLPLRLVGKTRLELATTRPPDAYANQLRYFPIDLPGTGHSVKSGAKVMQILDTTK